MKESFYNYIVKEEGKCYCFNAITRYFFDVPEEKEEALRKMLKYSDRIRDSLPVFYDKLVAGGFVVPEDTDELGIIREKYNEACNSKAYNLTILPTVDCNFRCWYCYENHTPYMISEKTIGNIKKYISNIIDHGEAESLHIEWFGGEPFLAFRNVIKPITLFAKKKCEEKNVPFSTGATSNGYLIDKKIAEDLTELNFKVFQVTLDGEKSHHDKTRVAPDGSSFETILKNMDYVCEINKNISIVLRINYDDKNLNPQLIIEQIKALINEKHRERFSFILRKVWQVEKVENGREKVLDFIKISRDAKFNYCRGCDLNLDFISCYAARKNMKLITPYGSVEKCTTKNNFEEQAIGHLTEEGTIEWKNNLPFDEIYATPLFETPHCLKCKRLPICMGVCPKCIDTDGTIGKAGQCKGKVNDLALTDAILNYCTSFP